MTEPLKKFGGHIGYEIRPSKWRHGYGTLQPWYHGSNIKFDTLLPGSTITQWRELAEAFSHQPKSLSYGDDKIIHHNGIQSGFLYVVDEPVVPGEDIYMHPRTTMELGHEWLTVKKPLKVRCIATNSMH